ncbi:MAG: hypothetical protein GHCLOJNM_01115 [bacterium]|nr:hypothetical protein [bacterium]
MKGIGLLVIVVLMVILHQDFWFWRNSSLVFGFLPVGLAYHVAYSILASLVMLGLVRFAWPKELEDLEVHAETREPENPRS